MAIGSVLRRVLSVAVLALAGCGGESKDPPRFGWADLQGTWDRLTVTTNDASGWSAQVIDVDAYGYVAFVSCVNAAGLDCTPTGTLRWEIDGDGNVTASGTAANPTLVGTMTAAKDLIFATASVLNAGTPQGFTLQVMRKRDASAAWSDADVAGLAFYYQALHTGSTWAWERGVGATDAYGAVTIASGENSSGTWTQPPPGSPTYHVDANGLVTRAEDASYHGVMTADKQAIFGVRTAAAGHYIFNALLVTGKTFAPADLAGSWSYKVLVSGPNVGSSNWGRGTFSIDAAGTLAFQSAVNAQGTAGTTGWTLQLAADGALTRADYASYRGQLDSGKRLFVRTQTNNETGLPPGPPSLSISAR